MYPTLRRAWPRDLPGAAICVQDVDVQCVLQFTLIHAAGCALHRHTSRVIHRLELSVAASAATISFPMPRGKVEAGERRTNVSHRFRYGNRRMVKTNESFGAAGGNRLFKPLPRCFPGRRASERATVPCSREIVARNRLPPTPHRPDRYPERPTLEIVTPDELRPLGPPRHVESRRLATARTVPTPRLPECHAILPRAARSREARQFLVGGWFWHPRRLHFSHSLLRKFLPREKSFVNDPSAGSPTETLLRLLLPLDDQVRHSFRHSGATRSHAGTNPRISLNHPIGSSDGRCVQRAGT